MNIKIARGVTFIELLVVAIIISVLAGISIPKFSKSFSNLQMRSFAKDLQSFMNYLQQRSKIESKEITLNIDNLNAKILAFYSDNNEIIKMSTMPSGVNANSTQREILFHPDGSIDKFDIKLTSRGGDSVSLTTKGVFNAVKIKNE